MTHAVLSRGAGTYSKATCKDDEGTSGFCTKKTKTEVCCPSWSYSGDDAATCDDLITRDGNDVDIPDLVEKCCLCGRAATGATSCSFCQAGKYNDKSTGTSSCTSCDSQSFHACTSATDCEYEGCVHPDTPAKASADNTKCFASSDNEVTRADNPLFAQRCYAVSKDDPSNFWLCPAKDKVTWTMLLFRPLLASHFLGLENISSTLVFLCRLNRLSAPRLSVIVKVDIMQAGTCPYVLR